MANTYYSGQGSFYVGNRVASTNLNPDDNVTLIQAPAGLTALGNVSALSIDIETTKFEHKESETGNRAVDVSIIQEKKGTFTMTLENINGHNLALALWGSTSLSVATPVTVEEVKSAWDLRVPLGLPNLASVELVASDAVPTVTYVEGAANDYTVDLVNGTITALSTGTITDGQTLFVGYTPVAGTEIIESFTVSSQERWMRFNGLNTIDDSNVVVDVFKASFDPLTGYQLINEEIAAIELTGNVLLDDTQPSASGTKSQFFREYIF